MQVCIYIVNFPLQKKSGRLIGEVMVWQDYPNLMKKVKMPEIPIKTEIVLMVNTAGCHILMWDLLANFKSEINKKDF